eukprot:111903-Rhodomonas_salina.5
MVATHHLDLTEGSDSEVADADWEEDGAIAEDVVVTRTRRGAEGVRGIAVEVVVASREMPGAVGVVVVLVRNSEDVEVDSREMLGACHTHTDDSYDDVNDCDEQEYDQEEDEYEQGYEAGVADDQQDYALSAMAPCRAAALGACFRDIAGFAGHHFGMDEPEPDTNIDIPADLQDLDIDINQSLPIALQRLSVNPFNLLLNLVALVALVAQCAKFTFDAVLPNARAPRTCTFLFMVITIFVLLSLVPGAACINILNSIHSVGPGDVGMAAAFGISSLCTNHYLVDSCCTTVIVCNNQYLHNIL